MEQDCHAEGERLRGHMQWAMSYRALLDECLFAFNSLPRQRIPDGDGGDTYKLAAKIEAAFKQADA